MASPNWTRPEQTTARVWDSGNTGLKKFKTQIKLLKRVLFLFVLLCFLHFQYFFLMHISYVPNIPLFGTKYSDRY